jgi:hypothetical protein
MDLESIKAKLKTLFRWENPKAKYLVGAFVLLFAALFVNQCRAAEFEVGGGVATGYSFNVLGSASGDRAGMGEATVRSDNNHWDLSIGYVGEQYTGTSNPVPDFGYVSGQYIVSFDVWKFEPFLGMGLSWHTHEEGLDYLLPSNVNASLSAGTDFADNWRIEVRHMSNASTKKVNRGQNLFLVGYAF